MHRKNGSNYILYLFASDIILTLMALFSAERMRDALPFGAPLGPRYAGLSLSVYVLAGVIWVTILAIINVYEPRKTLRAVDELQLLAVGVSTATLVFAGILYLTFRTVSRLLFGYFAVLDLAVLLIFRVLLRVAIRFAGDRRRGVERILIIGAGKVGQELAWRVRRQAWAGLELVGFLDDDPDKQAMVLQGAPVLGVLTDAPAVVESHRVDEVIVALPLRAHRRLGNLALVLQEQPVSVRVVPDYFDLAFFRATVEDFMGMPLVGLRDPAIDGFQHLVKRVLDLLLTSLMLLVLWPLMLLIAIVIRLDSPGPALFRQQRVGENGRLFWMHKFRSMVDGAEARRADVIQTSEDGRLIYNKRPDDPRVTRIGAILRRTSLDELPQFFNVLKGEMSLVGPRPELPWLVKHYEAWQRKRFAVPPGITGWWQINGRADRPMYLHTQDDLYYIQHYSPLLDLQILWRTIGVVLKGRGAY